MNGSPTVTAPLLVGEGLPAFGAITAAQVEEHIPELLSLLNGELDALEALLTLDAKTAASSIACVLVDLVGLKQTNILHGFTAGDALLRRAADRLRALAPDARLLARLGGDELVAVFVGPTAAARAAETSAAAAAPETPPLRSAWTELQKGEPSTELFDRLYAAARRGD